MDEYQCAKCEWRGSTRYLSVCPGCCPEHYEPTQWGDERLNRLDRWARLEWAYDWWRTVLNTPPAPAHKSASAPPLPADSRRTDR